MADIASDADATIGAPDAPPTPRGGALIELPRGAVIARYVVLGKLGAGGMGVVYLAYDPELDRQVALKLVHTAQDAGDERGRLLREAQALAKLAHPNVVTVHDAGTHAGRVWIAMELVVGKTLRAWLGTAKRSWAEALDVILSAGTGIAAAHAAALLHRDIKPDNVMIGEDGRVRVMDFGLARPHEIITDEGPGPSTRPQPRLAALELRMTHDGALLGTPAYMSPEQLAAARVGDASDQFSFCVMAWEALYGARPFVGETLPELAVAVIEGRLEAPPRGARVPTWLRRVIERGLEVKPDNRWPSMQALLDALAGARSSARVQRVVVGIGAAVLVVLAGFGVRELDVRSRIAACVQEGHEIDAVWNDDARARVRGGFAATESTQAGATTGRVMRWLDGYATEWQGARTEACLAVKIDARWDATTFDRAAWCLEERRTELEVLVEQFEHASAELVLDGVARAATLDRVEPCLDRDRLMRVPVPPPEQRDTARAVRRELARGVGLERVGKYDEALAVAVTARADAETVGWAPLVAAATAREATARLRKGEVDEAERLASEAYFAAAEAGAWEVAAVVGIRLVHIVGFRLARHADGKVWARHAAVALAHAGDPSGELEARRLNNLAAIAHESGDFAEAHAMFSRALGIVERVLGLEHPDVARALVNLAQADSSNGDDQRAQALLIRALPILENAIGPEHPDVAALLDALGAAEQAIGEDASARGRYEGSLAIRERAMGPDHASLATSLQGLAKLDLANGHAREAKVLFERALGLIERARGAKHPQVASALEYLARAENELGHRDRAIALQERAVAIREEALGADHPNLGSSLAALAELQLDDGDSARALELATRAAAIIDAHEGRHDGKPDAHFALARALVATGGDRVRARALAEQAAKELRSAGASRAKDLARVKQWLETSERE